MCCAAETSDVAPSALPAVTECASIVNGGGTVRRAAAAAKKGAVVQMVSAGRRVLDFREGRDEVRIVKDVLLELGGKGEETEGYCGNCCMITTHGAKSSLSSEFLKDRVGFACEADGAARKGPHGGERGEYTLSYVGGGDITDEVELECPKRDISKDVRSCKRPFVQNGLVPLGRHA